MVESNIALDRIFGALADVTRRDILKRVSRAEHTISELAEPYAMGCVAKTGAADDKVEDCIRLLPSQCPNPTRSSGDIIKLKSFCVASAGTAAIHSRTGK